MISRMLMMASQSSIQGLNIELADQFYTTTEVPKHLNVHSSGLFLYSVSYDSTENKHQIDLYSVNNSTGVLSLITSTVLAKFVNDMIISSDGKNLYVFYTDFSLETYSINQSTGYITLIDTIQLYYYSTLKISTDLKNLYAVSIQKYSNYKMIYVYDRNLSTGILTASSNMDWPENITYLVNPIISNDDKNLYLYFFATENTGVYDRNLTTGALTFNAIQNINQQFTDSNFNKFYTLNSIDILVDIYDRNNSTGALSLNSQTNIASLSILNANTYLLGIENVILGNKLLKGYLINIYNGSLTFSSSYEITIETTGTLNILSSAQSQDNKFFFLSSVLIVGYPGTNQYSKIQVFKLHG